MNLPLNMRYAIVDCIANYAAGGVMRTELRQSRVLVHSDGSFFLFLFINCSCVLLPFLFVQIFFFPASSSFFVYSFPTEIACNARGTNRRAASDMCTRLHIFFFVVFDRRNGVVIFAIRYASVVTKYC